MEHISNRGRNSNTGPSWSIVKYPLCIYGKWHLPCIWEQTSNYPEQIVSITVKNILLLPEGSFEALPMKSSRK